MKTETHWQDVFKVVIKETDFVLEILDARNPEGTHNLMIENFIKRNRPSIQTFLVINKIDIIPHSVMLQWKEFFENQGYRVYYVSARYNRGIKYLLKDLRGLKQSKYGEINVLIVGYPNTGKSTIIEALTEGKKKVGTSAFAGFTRSIKKIRLNDNTFLIDTPGVIPIDETNETELAIKSCMIADKLDDPLAVVEAIFDLIDKKTFNKVYKLNLDENFTIDELILQLGKKSGRLISGGRVNEPEVHKRIIRDWQSNKLKYYTLPPESSSKKDTKKPFRRIKPTEDDGKPTNLPPSLKNLKK